MIKKTICIIVLFFVQQLTTAQNCNDYILVAKEELSKNNPKEALKKLQDADECDYANNLRLEKQQLQIAIFNALEKQKKTAEDNLKKYQSEKKAKLECEALKEKTERQAKQLKDFNTWMESQKEVDDKSSQFFEFFKNIKQTNDSLNNYYEKKCIKDSLNYKNWLKLYYTQAKTNSASTDSLIKSLNKLLAINNTFGIAYILRSELDMSEYYTSLFDFEKAVELYPEYAGAYLNRAQAYHNNKKYQLALADYSKAIKLDSSIRKSYLNRANLYSQIKKYKLALEDYSKAIKLDKNVMSTYNSRGFIYQKLKQYELAIKDFTNAIELDQNHSSTYIYRGDSNYSLKKYESAIKDYNKAIKLFGTSSLYNKRANCYDNLKKYDLAISDYSKSIEKNKIFAGAYYNRGTTYKKIKKYEMAISDFTKAIVLYKKNNLRDSYEGYAKPLKSSKFYKEAHFYRGDINYNLKNYNKALADYTKYIELSRNEDKIAFHYRGDTYYFLENYKLAISDYSKAIELGVKDKKLYLRRGKSYDYIKKYNLAINDFNKVLELEPNNKEAIEYRKLCYDKLDK